MKVLQLSASRLDDLWSLHCAYKQEIGEEVPTEADQMRLQAAMETGQIVFYGCEQDGKLIGCCSVTPTFSTFDYRIGGIFEDFFVVPEARHSGAARALVRYAAQMTPGSLTVGCADCDVELYRALGFTVALGNLLAYE